MKDKTPLILGGAVVALGAWALLGRDEASAASPAPSGSPAVTPPVNMAAMTISYRTAQQSMDPAYIRRVASDLRAAGRDDLARELEHRASNLPGAGDVQLTAADQQAMASALRGMGVTDSGSIQGRPSPESIQIATALAARFEREGKSQAALQLRHWAERASQQAAPVATPQQVPAPPPGIDAETMQRITRILAMERDPARLRAAAALLRNHPAGNTPAAQALIGQLEALATQLEQAQRNAEAAQDVERIINEAPGMTGQPAAPAAAPAVSPVTSAGLAMVEDLRRVQGIHGMPGAKGRENQRLVKAYQAAAGLKQDGKAGPGTLTSLVSNGVYEVPLVMYWPSGTTAARVNQYRQNLRTIASALANEADANMVRMAANRERGQAGIVGPLAK